MEMILSYFIFFFVVPFFMVLIILACNSIGDNWTAVKWKLKRKRFPSSFSSKSLTSSLVGFNSLFKLNSSLISSQVMSQLYLLHVRPFHLAAQPFLEISSSDVWTLELQLNT